MATAKVLNLALHFYPRSPCGERPRHFLRPKNRENFYPRSPCGERPQRVACGRCAPLFLSTLSLRRATKRAVRGTMRAVISIHALLAESDALTEM